MELQCSACGEQNPERARFCLACGTPMQPAGDAPSASRRTVTILFADVVGFTSLGERLDSESLRQVMDRFYAEVRRAVEAEGGTVAKFIGDAVMAVWGAQAVREDDALRAVRAAEAMRTGLRAVNAGLDRRWGVRLGVRTGINTGEVVVDPARGVDLLVGDALNVAARLEQTAGDGDVLLGPDTARLVRHEVDLEPVAELALKGRSRPVTAWRLRSARPGEPPRGPRLEAPLVGREREIAHLRSAFYGAVGAREARLITVVGSPGVGKSRLVGEFAAGVGDEARVLTARCEATGEGATFLPLAAVVREAAGIDAGDAAPEAQAKVAALLHTDAERDLVAERAAGILGLGPDVGAEETFWALRRMFEALGAERPVVLVVDDVQWAQPLLLDLLEHLARWTRAALLVVAVARPELRDIRPELTAPGPVAMDVVALAPLGAEASRALVDRLLGATELPEGLAARIVETTGGNPLFLGETLRMLVDEGVLARGEDDWVVAGAAPVSVPPTIQALLAARIERLTPAERRVLEHAAVIGQRFTRAAVAHLLDADGLDDALEGLRRKELVVREPAVTDEPQFRFHHVLIRDAAYRVLLKEARAALHARYARWLAEQPGDHDAVVGYHLHRAYTTLRELGPLDADGRGLGRRAAERLRAAAARALAREDLRAAGDLLERALGPLEPGDPERLAVLLDLCEARLSGGDTARAQAAVEELIVLAEGDQRLEAWATVFACQQSNLAGAGHVRETIGRVRQAGGHLARLGDAAGEAKAFHVAASAHASLGQVAAAEVALDRALVAARAAGDRRRVTAVLSGVPRAALWGPSPIVRASGRCLDVVRILRMTPGNRHVEAAALRCQAVLEAMRGRPEAARRILDGCRETLEELGLTYELLEVAAHGGIVELLAGEPAAAERHLRAARDGFAALGAEAAAAQAAALLARALLGQDRDADAEQETRYAELRGGQDLKTALTWQGARAEALARRGEHDAALELAAAAVQLSEATDALPDKADARMALAAVLRQAGRSEEARAAAIEARDLYAEKEHAVGRARAEQEAGLAAAPAGDEPDLGAIEGRERDARGTAFLRRWTALINSNDWQALRALLPDDYVLEDRRQLGPQGDQHGPDEGLEVIRTVFDVADHVRWDVQAGPGRTVDGVTVTAGRNRVTGHMTGEEGPFVYDFGLIAVVDPDGRMSRGMLTEADDDAVLAGYDEQCAATFGRASRTWVERGPRAGGALVPDGAVTADHRTHSAGPVWTTLLADPDGRLRRVELFDTEDAAQSRMHLFALWIEGLAEAGRYLSTRDFSIDGARYSPELRFTDHRAGLRDTQLGVEAFWTATFSATAALAVDFVLLDARSPWLGSSRLEMRGETLHGAQFEGLCDQVVEVDPTGLVTRVELYDLGDPAVDARLDELEREAAAQAG